MFLEIIVARGWGMITCGNHLGVFVSNPENILNTPGGWVFVSNENLTLETLQMALDAAKEGRKSWTGKTAQPTVNVKKTNRVKKKRTLTKAV